MVRVHVSELGLELGGKEGLGFIGLLKDRDRARVEPNPNTNTNLYP